MNQKPIFVVSSGRTGSTILAKMLNRHPEILIVSDLIEPVGPTPFLEKGKVLSGFEFFSILSQPSTKPRLRYWRERKTKERLFYPDDENLVSLLLCYAIPFISDKPMELFNDIKEEFSGRGKKDITEHLIDFFEYLRKKFDRKIWVERTGGSLQHTKKILNSWPDAKIINNYRDGRETAISMRSYPFFRMYLMMLDNPDLDEWDFDYYPPVEEFGRMWNLWTNMAEDALSEFPESQKFNLSYENFVNDTYKTLLDLAGFIFSREKISSVDKEWAEKESENIKAAPIRFPGLSDDQKQSLEKECREGLKRLGYNLNYE